MVPRLASTGRLMEEDLGCISSGWREPVFCSYAAKVFACFLNVAGKGKQKGELGNGKHTRECN